jgi:integrase
VPVPRFLVDDLTAHVAGKAPDDLVFTSPKGSVLRVGGARRSWFDRAVETSGVPEGFHPHDLRHTAASLAVLAGANVKAVQRMLGHAKASMTFDVYADLFDDDLEAVAERLDVLALSISGTRATLADRFLPDMIVIRRSYVGGVPSGWRRRRVPLSGRDGSDAPG